MDIQEYKALSIKCNFGQPATPWDMYYYTVINTLGHSFDMRESKRTATLWKKSLQKCIDTLPRSKKFVQSYYYYDDGFFGVIITEQYVCGFEVCYSKNTAALNYDNDSESIQEEFATFDELCNRVDNLIDGEFDVFREMAEAYQTIKDALIFYKEHITVRMDKNTYDYLCDNDVVYSGIRGVSVPDKNAENWKV